MTSILEEHGIKHSRSQDLIDFAYTFAKHAHGEQNRKYTGEPYINHPVAVATIVSSVTEDIDMICAALLHDFIEDTPYQYYDINMKFGLRTAQMVLGLIEFSTKEDGNRFIRKELDRRYLSRQEPNIQTIKTADMIHNAEDIMKHDPNFAKVYLNEMRRLLQVMSRGNKELYAQASEIVERGLMEYEIEIKEKH